MKTQAICSFFALFAIAAVMVSSTPVAFADHPEVTIGAAEESGFSQDCAPDDCYIPGTATVDVGGVVIMTNTDTTGVHTFTSGTVDGFTPMPDGVFDSGVLSSGESFEWTPDTAGEYPYYCMLHTWMVGTIVAQEGVTHEEEAMEETMEEEVHEEEHMEEAMHSDEELMVEIVTGTAGAGEMLSIDVTFTTMSGDSVEHVNYNVKATQNGEVVLDDMGVHDHDGVMNHMTAPLPEAASDESPVDVEVTFNGYGFPGEEDNWTGPIGQVAQKQVVPEFGTVAMMVLAVAIISIIAVTAKSRVIPRL